MAETDAQESRKWPISFYLLVPFVMALLTVAFVELFLILFWPVPLSMSSNMYYRADPITGFAHEPGAVGRYPNGIAAIANPKGLRDHEVALEKPPKTRRILVLGDSFTVGVNVEMEEAYPQVLERMLNQSSGESVEVINAAIGGLAPFQYAQYFEHHGSEYSPDEVIVGFFVGNDTYNELSSVTQLPTVVNGERVSREAAEGSLVQLRIMLHQNFNLVRLLQGVSVIAVPTIRDRCENFGKNLLNIARMRLKNHRVDSGSDPRFSANAVYQIQRVKQRADEMGIPLTVVLIPDELQINEALRERVVAPEQWHSYDFAMPQQVLTEAMSALGIATLDLLPYYLEDQRCLYMNDTHWTPEGHVVAAAAIAQYLKNPGGIPKAVPVQTVRQRAVPARSDKVPVSEAVGIIQAYVAVLQKNKGAAPRVSDIGLLPLPKERIKAAAIALHLQATDPEEKSSFVGVAKSLALFQPNVGDTPISLEGQSSDGTPWRSIVEPEMQKIERAFAENKR